MKWWLSLVGNQEKTAVLTAFSQAFSRRVLRGPFPLWEEHGLQKVQPRQKSCFTNQLCDPGN